jgi:hypothetical protein
MRVISSPSISTIGLATLILVMIVPRLYRVNRMSGGVSSLKRGVWKDGMRLYTGDVLSRRAEARVPRIFSMFQCR